MRPIHAVLLAALVGAAPIAVVGEAGAQTPRERALAARSKTPPLTVRPRAVTDGGAAASAYERPNHLNMETIWSRPAWDHQRGRLGGETLPRPFDPPGRPAPLFEF